MAGNAIAAIGPGAAPAVPALIAACSVKGEQVHVLRACAAALGRDRQARGDPGAAGPAGDREAAPRALGGGGGDPRIGDEAP